MAKLKKKRRRRLEIRLETRRPYGHYSALYDVRFNTRYVKYSLPFYSNERGLLAHRVRYVAEHLRNGKVAHRSVTYLCNNSTCVRAGGEFLSEPNRLLCMVCEFMAKRQGKPSADELVGHHVHVGKLRVEQACCCDKRGNN